MNPIVSFVMIALICLIFILPPVLVIFIIFLTKKKKTNADEIKKYKELLDDGAITQDEFETKKKQLLGLD